MQTLRIIIWVESRHLSTDSFSPLAKIAQQLLCFFRHGIDQIHGFAKVVFNIIKLSLCAIKVFD